MTILIPISPGGEAEAQKARKWLVLPCPRKVPQACWKTNPVLLCPGSQLNPSGCYHLWKKSYVLLLLLVMHHLKIRFALFSQHSLFSLISDVSSSVAQPDTFLHEEPCVFPSFSCLRPPPVSVMSLIIQNLFWFIKCTASITVVLWRPCLSRDVPLSVIQMQNYAERENSSSSRSEQIEVVTVSLEFVPFEM